jgi:hypothetical protein
MPGGAHEINIAEICRDVKRRQSRERNFDGEQFSIPKKTVALPVEICYTE